MGFEAANPFVVRLLGDGVAAYAVADRLAIRLLTGVRDGVAGLLSRALTVEEQRYLTHRLYARSMETPQPAQGLFSWEEMWFAQSLPSPPARLLLGAAGEGRELAALAALGYRIDAFEPDSRAAHRCQQAASRTAFAAEQRVIACSYQDLSAAVLDERGGAAAAFTAQRYDAVILGWGSFHHLLDGTERVRLVEACHRLAPCGPLLASYWQINKGHGNRAAHRWGRAVGRRVQHWRRVGTTDADVLFTWSSGFGHGFSRDELVQLAARVGRKCVWGSEGGYPHVTMVAESDNSTR